VSQPPAYLKTRSIVLWPLGSCRPLTRTRCTLPCTHTSPTPLPTARYVLLLLLLVVLLASSAKVAHHVHHSLIVSLSVMVSKWRGATSTVLIRCQDVSSKLM
jgi:hypothetical protein